jgi:hypothetical protein
MRFLPFLAFMVFAAALHAAAAQSSDLPASEPVPEPALAELYIFNDSGRTLIPSDQVITDNGQRLVRLPRQTYIKLQISPGAHLLKPDPPLWKQEVSLNVVAGHRYYVVIAYRPERSWATPLAGAPLILREISEQEAVPLLHEMKAR